MILTTREVNTMIARLVAAGLRPMVEEEAKAVSVSERTVADAVKVTREAPP